MKYYYDFKFGDKKLSDFGGTIYNSGDSFKRTIGGEPEHITLSIPNKGEIIVYDRDDNTNYERFKIGDGIKTISQLPFYMEDLREHTQNTDIHVTAEEKAVWNTRTDASFKPAGKSYLTFSSPNSFTLAVNDMTKHWDGTLEYLLPTRHGLLGTVPILLILLIMITSMFYI